MNKMKKLALVVLAAGAMSGCASTRTAELAGADAAPAAPVQMKVMRPLPSYGTMGGYRYRRFTAFAAAS